MARTTSVFPTIPESPPPVHTTLLNIIDSVESSQQRIDFIIYALHQDLSDMTGNCREGLVRLMRGIQEELVITRNNAEALVGSTGGDV
ncbi:hypothetical protein Selin_1484 [Desulfurispirillum indicum S5]|uniref:Uncharacterized protein n=1 Tax=Desulfurispirillum indicum (strain ATCC BAA-1389 / DSM 22839 / S5) TaxID=653733 RepID=E6W6X5_DESIS|nr:hypothetical protein [Desulfurispirillum indicum]ADU66218.1 hypothetical protein Selin_1484 [Desulfurispirillum indicum S5]